MGPLKDGRFVLHCRVTRNPMNCQWEGHFPYLKYVQELCAIYASLLPESDAGRRLLRPETVELLTTTARRGVAADESLQLLWGMMTFFGLGFNLNSKWDFVFHVFLKNCPCACFFCVYYYVANRGVYGRWGCRSLGSTDIST